MKRFNKLMYGWFYIISPLVFVIGSILWKYYLSDFPLIESVTDTLSILGIYYFFMSILWFFNMNKVERVSREMENTHNQQQKDGST
jgi:hypothetical protein